MRIYLIRNFTFLLTVGFKIFIYRLKELTDNVDTKNVNGMGAARAMLILTPLLLITALFEYLWIRIFGGNTNKYT